jgi:polyisoprenoid-binding protein YceI
MKMNNFKMIFAALILALNAYVPIQAQKIFTRDGIISFDATTPLDEIKATSKGVNAIIDLASGKMEILVLVKGFHFKRDLMEQHFNENYMESGKFPKANFVGELVNPKSLDLKKDGTYSLDLKGKLTMHGVTRDVSSKANFVVKGGLATAKTDFKVLVADYNIQIPSVVKDKIAKEAKISVNLNLQPMK